MATSVAQDPRRRRASAKGSLTKAIAQLDTHEHVAPRLRNKATILHLKDLINKAEATYTSTMEGETSDEEDEPYQEFTQAIQESHRRILRMVEQRDIFTQYEVLHLEMTTWEKESDDELARLFPEQYSRLNETVVQFCNSVFSAYAAELPELQSHAADMRKRVASLKTRSLVKSPTHAISTILPAEKYLQDKKARTVPLPVFSGALADWRTFWRRFIDYTDKLRHITDDERLSYLQDCLQDPVAKEIVEDAIRNGDPFSEVERTLKSGYDRPRDFFTTAITDMMSAPVYPYTPTGLAEVGKELTKFRNILARYGDGSAEQLITAFWESKLAPKFLTEWKLASTHPNKVPYTQELIDFCLQRQVVLGSSDAYSERRQNTKSTPPSRPTHKASKPHTVLHSADFSPCRLCSNSSHPLYSCPEFRDMDVQARNRVVQSHHACYNCLSTDHGSRQCPSRRTCKDCGGKHHTLLHRVNRPTQHSNSFPAPVTTPAVDVSAATTLTASIPDKTTLVWSCLAVLEHNNKTLSVRAMIDPGSTLSFITDKAASALRASKIPFPTTISGLAQSHAATSQFKVELQLRSPIHHSEPTLALAPSVVASITGVTPANNVTEHADLAFTQTLQLADPNFGSPGRIDLLLGQDVLAGLLRPGLVQVPHNNFYSINTMLGWVVGGHCSSPAQAVTSHICCRAIIDQGTDQLLRAFWETEELPSDTPHLSEEDKDAVAQYQDTVSRDEDGRYIVRLPRRQPAPPLGHSRTQAARRFSQNKRSLSRQGRWDVFQAAVEDYEQMGHAEPIPPADQAKEDSQTFYLPMHGVTKASSTSTKLRVVFDASASTTSGHSLNDMLLSGPTLYPLLTNVLIRFRQHTIGMSADISKMFREVSLHPEDRDLHRYLVERDNAQLVDRRMTRVTFGVTSSPFLATQVLRTLAENYSLQHPQAAHCIGTSFYVDDCLTGASNLHEATQLRQSLNQLLGEGCMTLRKWRSNSDELKSSIPEDLLETESVQLISAPSDCHKALGVHWDTSHDTLHVATPSLCTDDAPTKRQVLSDIARTFDVLGWFSPVTVTLKIMLQKIWHLQLEWDQLIPPEMRGEWSTWREELPLITSHSIPRHYFQHLQPEYLQLHGFCDASQVAYAGVVYVRAMHSDTSVSIEVVISKSKVAPIKTVTIPKLELCSAVLVSKLLHNVGKELHISLSNIFAWSDSTIALGWINTPPHRLKVYVANRVAAINDHLPSAHWRHVSSGDNPADLASRGVTAGRLIQSEFWWHGPPWLSFSPTEWPVAVPPAVSTLPEIKTTTLISQPSPMPEDYTTRYSSFNKLLAVLSWVRRFITNSQGRPPDRVFSPQLFVREIQGTEVALLHLHQKRHFGKELASLKAKLSVCRTSSLHALKPLLDSDGLIRVGGRLSQSGLPYSQLHPIIMHGNSTLSRLLVKQMHLDHHHAGPTLLLGLLARSHHILRARHIVRSTSRQCTTCQKVYARTAKQLMGELPASRVQPSPAFSCTGIDFAGPVLLKLGHTRKPVTVKAYIALFVCLATKAIHLELVSDLSTSAFLAAFRRFVARRGCPREVRTDNGTNFVGANNELQLIYDTLHNPSSQQQILHHAQSHRIRWTFSPGRAPHFGGLWEAGVKSAKILIRKLLGTQLLTFEEYGTILAEVEATLNSRPLTPLDALPEDGIDVLTPGHFLIGRPLLSLPAPAPNDLVISNRRRWNLCQKITSEFWTRWSTEYLHLLQKRSKWETPRRNFIIGDVVLLKDQELYTRSWPLAVVTQVFPGPDGNVRAVNVRTAKGTYNRPITKLVLISPASDTPPTDTPGTSSSRPGEDVQAQES